jgi:hypothetical protein
MPRGSKPGERRGGRQRATPNKRTLLAERILWIAAASPTASHDEIVTSLMNDPMLPASLRLAVAQAWHADARSRRPGFRPRKCSSKTSQPFEPSAAVSADRPVAEGAPENAKSVDPSATVERSVLPILFAIAQDGAAKPRERRRAALALTRYFVPKKSTVKKSRLAVSVSDECGFVVDPDRARELRDLKLELDCLPRSSKKRSPHIVARIATRLQKRIKEIQQFLACPCPSRYQLRRHLPDGPASEVVQDGDILQDKARLDSFRRRRLEKQILTPEEDFEEALRTARYDSFLFGEEMRAREHLNALQEERRAADEQYGPRLSAEGRALWRALTLLYPPPHNETTCDPDSHPFLDLPFTDEHASARGPRQEPTKSNPQSAANHEFEEFAPCPPFCAVDQEMSEKKGRTILKFWYEDPNSGDESGRD